jgi:hypothetical protein
MRYRLLFICFLIIAHSSVSQTLPANRSVDWTLAGLRDTTTNGFAVVDMQAMGAMGNGTTNNDSVMTAVLASLTGTGAILIFQAGNFLFNHPINLSSNSFNISGSISNPDTSALLQAGVKDSNYILISDSSHFSINDWVQIIQLDTDLVTSTWAWGTVGQIVQIHDITNNTLVLNSPLRMDYSMSRAPYIRKILPKFNVGIECIKILRTDNTAPEQASNILFNRAVNCWVAGIESQNTTFSHIEAEYSANISVTKSYLNHAFEYGDGGRGYGVVLDFTASECRVENNVFEHLRHSMLLQAGSNGNVFAYNYSFDPYWTTTPTNSAGDMVLHGNYVYSNLFEQNICRNIVIDDSHGPNGPYNTFFRNRSEGYGLFFSATNSPNQNFIGNDIPNTGFPYSLVNYTILGSGHFLHGNNNKGTITPAGTQVLPDISYAYTARPDFVAPTQWAAIGTPNVMGAASIPAKDRYTSGNIFSNACDYLVVNVEKEASKKQTVRLYPNPASSLITIESTGPMNIICVKNSLGQELIRLSNPGNSKQIDLREWSNGLYFLYIQFGTEQVSVYKIMKQR